MKEDDVKFVAGEVAHDDRVKTMLIRSLWQRQSRPSLFFYCMCVNTDMNISNKSIQFLADIVTLTPSISNLLLYRLSFFFLQINANYLFHWYHQQRTKFLLKVLRYCLMLLLKTVQLPNWTLAVGNNNISNKVFFYFHSFFPCCLKQWTTSHLECYVKVWQCVQL